MTSSATPRCCSTRSETSSTRASRCWHASGTSPESSPSRRLRALVGQQLAQRPEVDVEVGSRQVVASLELVHRLLEVHQAEAETLHLLVGEIALVDSAERLRLHELSHQLDDGEHELEQVTLHRLRVGLQPLWQQPP